MLLSASVFAVARQTAAIGSAPSGTAGPGNLTSLPAVLPLLGPAIAAATVIALAVGCLIVVALTVRAHVWQRVAIMRARRVDDARDANAAASGQRQVTASGSAGDSRAMPIAAAPWEPRSDLDESAAGADLGFDAVVAEVPGVGRIEWDAETLRTFACQPDVLHRLAFYRWRLRQGMLSEFDVAPRPRSQAPADTSDDTNRKRIQASQLAAPNSQGMQARGEGQQTGSADQ